MSKAVKYVFIVMSVTILAKIIGFARDIAMAGVLGASQYTDAYLVALSILEMLSVIFVSAFGTIFIPIFSKLKKTRGSESAIDFTRNAVNIMMFLGLLLAALGIVFTKQIISALAPGFDSETFSLAVGFSRVLLFGAVFLAGNCIFTAYLQSNESFAVPAAISIPYNIIITVSMFMSVVWDIKFLVYGTLLAMAVQFAMQFIAVRRKAFRYRFKMDLRDDNVREMARLAPPLMLSSSILQVQAVADKILVSGLAVGSITAMSLAQRLYSFAVEIFAKSVLTVTYPIISGAYAENNMSSLKGYIERAIITVTLLSTPVTFLTVAFSTPIIRALFERGSFGPAATEMTAVALSFYASGIVFGGLLETFTSSFYSIKDTRTPLVTSIAGMVVNISLKLLLIRPMGLGGIALATSLSYLFIALFLALSLRKKIGPYGGARMLGVFAKILAASALCAAAAKAAYALFTQLPLAASQLGMAASLGASLLLGVSAYVLLALMLRIDEALMLMGIIKDKLKSQLNQG